MVVERLNNLDRNVVGSSAGSNLHKVASTITNLEALATSTMPITYIYQRTVAASSTKTGTAACMSNPNPIGSSSSLMKIKQLNLVTRKTPCASPVVVIYGLPRAGVFGSRQSAKLRAFVTRNHSWRLPVERYDNDLKRVSPM